MTTEETRRRSELMRWAMSNNPATPPPEPVEPIRQPAPALPVATGQSQHRTATAEVLGPPDDRAMLNEMLRWALSTRE